MDALARITFCFSNSSLHWLIPRSFLFVFVQWSVSVIGTSKLSSRDIIVSQKSFQWRRKVTFLLGGLLFYSLSLHKTYSLVKDTYLLLSSPPSPFLFSLPFCSLKNSRSLLYSIVRKGHKRKPKQANGDYSNFLPFTREIFFAYWQTESL